MATTITINNDSQTNTSISFVLPIPTIIIELPFNHQSNNGVSTSCEYCGRSNSLQKNDKKEVKIDENVIHLKDEIKIDENVIYLKDEIKIDENVIYLKDEIKIDENVIYLKDEVEDIKPIDNCIEEEVHAMFDIDERLSNNDPNMYNNIFSPISIADSIDTETKQTYVPEYYDEDYNAIIKESFQDIFEIVEYLKHDIIMN